MLTPGETRIMDMVNQFNRLCDDGHPVGTIFMSKDAVEVLERYGIATPVKVVPTQEGRMRVYLSLKEFEKYLSFACKQVGFTLLLNGGVRTEDGLIVEPTFPNDAVSAKSKAPVKKGN